MAAEVSAFYPAPRVTWRNIREEPFRIFFPVAVLAGLIGVLLWPLHFAGWITWYPGANHARLMAFGFFGGFMLGFLGTALPRMLGSPKLTAPEVALLVALQLSMVAAFTLAYILVGERLLLAILGVLALSLGWRFIRRTDLPPPGFILVALALLCAATGTVLGLLQEQIEDRFFLLSLKPLLQFHGFILFPILGVGGFILPRFFDLPSRHDFPESPTPTREWTREALIALGTGLAICFSFAWEAAGHGRVASAFRFLVSAAYLYWQLPLFSSKTRGSSLALALRLAFLLLPAGFLAVALFPAHRVALLHLTFIGGFSVLTLCVATRVVFGHSGQQKLLTGRLRWLTFAVILMMLGMVTRISGDYSMKILPSHYSYGGLLWACGLLIWAVRVLPGVLRPDPD